MAGILASMPRRRLGCQHGAPDDLQVCSPELVGTFVFLSVIALSANAGPLAPLAIGSVLMVMVYMGGPISGAHYNPAVSFGAFLRFCKIDAATMAALPRRSLQSWAAPPGISSSVAQRRTRPGSSRRRRAHGQRR